MFGALEFGDDFDLICKAINVLRTGGANQEFWEAIAEAEAFARKIVDFAKESANNQVFDLMIDYDRSLDEMVEAGRYDDVEKGITKSHFPIKGSGQHAVSAVPFHPNFGRKGEITLKGVTTEIRNRNYRPGRIEELLALGENHPDLQNRFPIVATGSIWRNRRDGVRRVPGLWNGHFSGAGRCLFLSTITRGWGEQYRFLAVCN